MNHSYIPLDQYRRKWIFNHKDLPVSDLDKTAILPLDQKSAMEVWNRWISNKSSCAEDFTKGDWASRSSTWHQTEHWQSHWDSEDNSLPEPLADFIDWPADAPVYFCYEKYQVIQTRWEIFARNWKCFLFFDDGPLLISPKHKQAVWFSQDGNFKMGLRG
ncbi:MULTISPECIES: DUF2947 domain-containing protein [Shewanella]|uniref:DUF2947 family protein n=1 Tax=Shewanella chilikensis TaxID=558541 RepID=A0A6G7LQG1_9GAMM|nr:MULTISPECIES: DUF2947 domain-containing protein [Shewanella]MBZ4680617.1 hypothetical protein [Shewanella sp.]MCA0951847.1 DUF2947 domain-containing protein [Shewanella chilikensis]MCL1152560.1 DUF2947 domain-containing protein [Shewanella chilikensis]PYE56105.1 hypothetical protein C8J23_1329 [Shewanella chilikensis]QIJ03999.1 DUF2947 family protein [Shewanella chilikensis]